MLRILDRGTEELLMVTRAAWAKVIPACECCGHVGETIEILQMWSKSADGTVRIDDGPPVACTFCGSIDQLQLMGMDWASSVDTWRKIKLLRKVA